LALTDEEVHLWKFKVEFVGDGFHCQEWKIMFLGGAGYGGGFHVNGMGSVGFRELALLAYGRDFGVGGEDGSS